MKKSFSRFLALLAVVCIFGIVGNEDYAAQKADEALSEEIRELHRLAATDHPLPDADGRIAPAETLTKEAKL